MYICEAIIKTFRLRNDNKARTNVDFWLGVYSCNKVNSSNQFRLKIIRMEILLLSSRISIISWISCRICTFTRIFDIFNLINSKILFPVLFLPKFFRCYFETSRDLFVPGSIDGEAEQSSNIFLARL